MRLRNGAHISLGTNPETSTAARIAADNFNGAKEQKP
jgi:hypothetical protein